MVRIDGTNFQSSSNTPQEKAAAVKPQKKMNTVFDAEKRLKDANDYLNQGYYQRGDTIYMTQVNDTIYLDEAQVHPEKYSIDDLNKKIDGLSGAFKEKVLNENYDYTKILPEMSDNNRIVYERGNIEQKDDTLYYHPQDSVEVTRQEVRDYNIAQELTEIRDEKLAQIKKEQLMDDVQKRFNLNNYNWWQQQSSDKAE